MKKYVFLTAGLLAVVLNAKPMAGDAGRFLGGADSSKALKDRVDQVLFDGMACVWGHCLPYTKGPGDADSELREIKAATWQTKSRMSGSWYGRKVDPMVAEADQAQLATRVSWLSRIQKSMDDFKTNLLSARERVFGKVYTFFERGESDKIDKLVREISQTGTTDKSGLKAAEFVNEQLAGPHRQLKVDLEKIKHEIAAADPESRDPFVVASLKSASKFVLGGKPYEKSLRVIASELKTIERADALKTRAALREACGTHGAPVACRAGLFVSDVADGWRAVKDKALSSIYYPMEDEYVALQEIGGSDKVLSFYDRTLESAHRTIDGMVTYGTDWEAHPYKSYTVQSGKVVGGAVLAVVGAYVLYKLGKVSWRGLCALKNAVWSDRSKLGKAAMLLTIGSAVAAAPGVALRYGYLQ